MARSTAVVLVGFLIGLVVYVTITSAALVRDLDAIAGVELKGIDSIAQSGPSVAGGAVERSDTKQDAKLVQLHATKKRKVRPVNHHAKFKAKAESVTLLL
jgi:hypothetical protein